MVLADVLIKPVEDSMDSLVTTNPRIKKIESVKSLLKKAGITHIRSFEEALYAAIKHPRKREDGPFGELDIDTQGRIREDPQEVRVPDYVVELIDNILKELPRARFSIFASGTKRMLLCGASSQHESYKKYWVFEYEKFLTRQKEPGHWLFKRLQNWLNS